MNRFDESSNELFEKGWTVRQFEAISGVSDFVKKIESVFKIKLATLNYAPENRSEMLSLMDEISEYITQESMVGKIFESEKAFLKFLLGPDLLIQDRLFFRVQQANRDTDSVGFHRDTFYGNAVDHINFWVPLINLNNGAGMLFADGTHKVASQNIKTTEYEDPIRRATEKGDLANKLGFVYAPKTDDTISSLKEKDCSLVTPAFGEYIVFFGNIVHAGVNKSTGPRVSFDVRFTHPYSTSSVSDSFFKNFETGLVSQVKEIFLEK